MTTWQVLRWHFSVGDLVILTALRFAGVIMAACRACGSLACVNHARCITRNMLPRWRRDWLGFWGSLGAVHSIYDSARDLIETRTKRELSEAERDRLRGHAGAVLLEQMREVRHG